MPARRRRSALAHALERLLGTAVLRKRLSRHAAARPRDHLGVETTIDRYLEGFSESRARRGA